MASVTLSGITVSIIAPILPLITLEKLIRSLVEYLSRDESSSSSEEDKLQPLENALEALEDVKRKLEIMQTN